MSESTNAYSLSNQIRQIQGNIGTTNTIIGFLNNQNLSRYYNATNKDDQNILKVLSDILVSLVGSQDQLKKLISDIITNNLGQIETKVKTLLKQYTLELLSCGIDGKLNVPNGVIDIPGVYPYIDQYDFYGLFTKDINDPIQKLRYDENLNTFIKQNIDNNNTTFTWTDQSGVDVVKFTYDSAQEKILVGPPAPASWNATGIGIKEFTNLYLDSINLFPTSNVLKSLLDQIFSLKSEGAYDIDLDFLQKKLFKQYSCKAIEDDRSKSTFDINYYDFKPEIESTETDETVLTNIKFGPVDSPIPNEIIPKQPILDETYLSKVSVLNKTDFTLGSRPNKSDQINQAIDSAAQNVDNQTTPQNSQLNTKFTLQPGIQADMNVKMLLTLPVILATQLFTPKITMFYGIIYKRYYIQNPNKNLWTTKDEYYEFMSKLSELVVRDILEYLLQKLFVIIKREIIKLIKKLIVKVLGEKVLGYITQIKSILDLVSSLTGQIPPTLPSINFKKCDSILDGINRLFNIPNIPPGLMLPPGLSLMGMSKSGLSPTQMTQDAVKIMNESGMNTLPLPDGSPNPNVVMANAISTAMIKQLQTNAKIQVSTINTPVYGQGGGTII